MKQRYTRGCGAIRFEAEVDLSAGHLQTQLPDVRRNAEVTTTIDLFPPKFDIFRWKYSNLVHRLISGRHTAVGALACFQDASDDHLRSVREKQATQKSSASLSVVTYRSGYAPQLRLVPKISAFRMRLPTDGKQEL
ncbi:MAG: hypothetical protein JO334_14775 [Verrucomicrobia bacterium]|nr:hypothetical protein [Verrucomicrobiota bacterium]